MNSVIESVRTVKTPSLPTIPDEDGGDWEAYRRHLEAEESLEMLDRAEAMEQIRRADFAAAMDACHRIRGIAATLEVLGRGGLAARLVTAADDVAHLVDIYG